ncbi:MAG: hypothetical protein V4857_23035 [Pseudomonadota bacterium]
MKRQHPSPFDSIPLSQHACAQLIVGALFSDGKKEDWEIAEEAIEDWTCRNNPDALAMPTLSGYQWKKLFLPDGTLLRTVFDGKNHHCLVQGDAIVYDGRKVSPSGFANAVGGIRRNAWKCLWIRLPNTGEWQLAETLRPRERVRHARAAPEAIKPSPPPTTPTPGAPLAAPASARQCQCTCAAAGAPAPQRSVDGDRPEAFANLVALPLRGVQRVGKFRRHKSRIAGATPARGPGSIQDVVSALRRAEAHRKPAWADQHQKRERLYVAWIGIDEGGPVPAS